MTERENEPVNSDTETTTDEPMFAIVVGPDDDGIAAALEAEGVTVEHLGGIVSRPALEEAGIVDADVYVLTDVGQATTIPIVRDLTDDDLRTVAYARDTIPEFVRGQLDLAIDPQLAEPTVVAEELAGTAE